MSTKTVRLKEDVYERIKTKKREEETFSEAIDRLTRDASLLDLGDSEEGHTPDRQEKMLRLVEETEEQGEAKLDEQLGIDDS